MRRQTDRYQQSHWRSPAPDVAVLVEQGIPTALLVFAPFGLRSSELRNITAELINEDEIVFTISQGKRTPTREQVNRPWLDREAGEDVAHSPVVIGARQARLARAYGGLAGRAFMLDRSKATSPSEFYVMVAAFHQAAVEEGVPATKAIADIGDVPHTTAARWVREARRRGYLRDGSSSDE